MSFVEIVELFLKCKFVLVITFVNELKQKLHHFCNRFSPDDGPKSGRKY